MALRQADSGQGCWPFRSGREVKGKAPSPGSETTNAPPWASVIRRHTDRPPRIPMWLAAVWGRRPQVEENPFLFFPRDQGRSVADGLEPTGWFPVQDSQRSLPPFRGDLGRFRAGSAGPGRIAAVGRRRLRQVGGNIGTSVSSRPTQSFSSFAGLRCH